MDKFNVLAGIINADHFFKVKPKENFIFEKVKNSVRFAAPTKYYYNDKAKTRIYLNHTINEINNLFDIDFSDEKERVNFINILISIPELALLRNKEFYYNLEVIENIDDSGYILKMCFVDNKNLKY